MRFTQPVSLYVLTGQKLRIFCTSIIISDVGVDPNQGSNITYFTTDWRKLKISTWLLTVHADGKFNANL
jgi:hypothetical protein